MSDAARPGRGRARQRARTVPVEYTSDSSVGRPTPSVATTVPSSEPKPFVPSSESAPFVPSSGSAPFVPPSGSAPFVPPSGSAPLGSTPRAEYHADLSSMLGAVSVSDSIPSNEGLSALERYRTTRSVMSTSTVVTCPVGFEKRGNDGDKFQVITNYYHMNEKSNFTLNQYRVDFSPVEDNTKIKKLLMKVHEKTLGSYIFDGHMMYKTELIPAENLSLKSEVSESGIAYSITLRLVGVVNPDDSMYLQFYNIVMRKCMSLLQMEELGRHFYDRNAAINFHEDRLELWPGFITAIRNHQIGTLLCADVTHKVLRTSSVLDVITSLRRPNMSEERLRDLIKKELIGTIVITHYNRKTYRIDDVDFNTTPKSHFRGQDGVVMQYAEYYKKRYMLSINTMEQPMLVSEPKQKDKNKGITGRIYLVPSLCNCTGLTDDMRKNFQLMKKLSEHLHMEPLNRKKKLDEFMNKLRTTPQVQEEFRNWNVDFNPNFIQAPARLFPREKIYLGPADMPQAVNPDDMADWTNQFRQRQVLVPKQLDGWVMFVPEQNFNLMDNFLQTLRRMAQQIGLSMTQPLEVIRYDGRARNIDAQSIKRIFGRYRNDLKFVFFILPNNQLQKYAEVKRICCLEFGVACQCFVAKNMQAKSLNSICTKVMIQINAKIGGEPWAISVPLKKLMVLGFDVYHCPTRKNESVGAIVSTTSANLARYFSTVSFHKDKSELSSNLAIDMSKCLIAYYDHNGFLPDRIVLFRDGVGEGQINFVLEHEVQQIKLAIKKEFDRKNMGEPKFSFIIVTKKINTRAIVESRGRFINPLPGTVIDDVITLPERYDFFLVAQSVRQGTVSPTSYNVIEDTSGMSADKMQRLAYKMCHMYFNWSGTVAVPAPCQYAHKLAYLTGVALADSAPLRLCHLLWYL